MNKLILIVAALLLAGCAKTLYVPVERIRTVTETLHDTVVVTKLEKESATQIVRDTTSTVETKYATSTATWHGTAGELEHSIRTKDTPLEVRVQYVERVITDSIPTPYPVEVTVEVDKPTRLPLRWWENFFLWIGVITLITVIIWIAIKRLNK